MRNNNLFYRYYDDLYFSKDYKGEVDSVLSLVRTYYPEKVKKILEVGAGTGNHTREFARQKFAVTAIDTDEKMFYSALKKLSRDKFPNVNLRNIPVENLEEKNFDFAVAGFNVVNYLHDFNSLLLFFDAVSARLKPKGLLIFDCWNGIAAIMDPPASKTIRCKSGKNFIHCSIQSETSLMAQRTALVYEINVMNEKEETVESGIFSFEQMLWTPVELQHCINNSGMKTLLCCRPFQPDTIADETDWKIMFVCQKRN
jgi:2-polyprenyl-3-methyl-5-hydroxy-6-metoxy-1,4-benzoquinol methylase